MPGTTGSVVRRALESGSGLAAGAFGLAMNPEFLREGSAVADFQGADRIVIGEWDAGSGDAAARLYESFSCPIVRVSLTNAEMIKYASNALLSSLVSFSNERCASGSKARTSTSSWTGSRSTAAFRPPSEGAACSRAS